MSENLFDTTATTAYSAKDIEVLEGLEPVRKRPGMYIGGADERAMHHLVAEVLDNAMDEAVAGHANRIEIRLYQDGSLGIRDNGRGIPTDSHPKYQDKSALEVIFTVLHSGGKFSGDAYQTSGGLHGVGVSVVNALSEWVDVEVCRDRQAFGMRFERGKPVTKLEKRGASPNRRGTEIRFFPDAEIFGKRAVFRPARLYKMARSKAYLFGGVEIRWRCDQKIDDEQTPNEASFHFPGGLAEYLQTQFENLEAVCEEPFSGRVEFSEKFGPDTVGAVEWAMNWAAFGDGFTYSYVNTVPTPQGGTHETGLRTAITRGLRAHGELIGQKKAAQITAEDVFQGAGTLLSVFIRDPEFVGQTKEKLSTTDAARLVEGALKDRVENWLAADPKRTSALIELCILRADERLKRRAEREVSRKSATKRLRLPGKLADCSGTERENTELFLVEGDSAGGSAKQARNRKTQAVLPLRGKILNVANATPEKLAKNEELQDLLLALGVQTGTRYKDDDLRYGKVIIMTDADVDGAHIAALLMTFFLTQLRGLVDAGRLYLAAPPLYRLTQGGKSLYARDDAHKDELLDSAFKGKGKIDIGRFKGLGEMMAKQLKETTMTPETRQLIRVKVDTDEQSTTADLVNRLMGKKPELRFEYIRENAQFVEEIDL